MKRSTVIAICLALLGAGLVFATVKHFAANFPSLEITEVRPTIIINGKEVDFKELYGRPILNIQGRTMLPLRAFAYYVMGIDPKNVTEENDPVHFVRNANNPAIRPDGESINHIYIETKDRRIDFWEGFPYIWIQYKDRENKYVVKTDVPPIIVDEGHTYMPFRAEAYAFGYDVEYNKDTDTITISDGGPDPSTGGIEGVFETLDGYTIMNTERGSLQGQGKEELFPARWDGKDMGFVKPSSNQQKDENTIPYQKYITQGLLKEYSYSQGMKNDSDYKIYEVPDGKEKEILKIAYDSTFKNSGRFIIAKAFLWDEGDTHYQSAYIEDWGPMSKLVSNENWDTSWGSFDLNSERTWERILRDEEPFEIMSINGIPWQDTPYKDVIMEATFKSAEDLVNAGPLKTEPYYKDVYLDKSQNGYTSHRLYLRQGDFFSIWVNSTKAEIWKGWKCVKTIQLPVKPFMDGSHVMVPLKPLMDYAGYKSSVVANGNNITVKDKGHTYVFTLNSTKAKIDGKEVTISKPLYQKNGYTFISLDVVKSYIRDALSYEPRDKSWNISVADGEMWSR